MNQESLKLIKSKKELNEEFQLATKIKIDWTFLRKRELYEGIRRVDAYNMSGKCGNGEYDNE